MWVPDQLPRGSIAKNCADAMHGFADIVDAVGVGKADISLALDAKTGAGDRRDTCLLEE